jgi:hypothetical protein
MSSPALMSTKSGGDGLSYRTVPLQIEELGVARSQQLLRGRGTFARLGMSDNDSSLTASAIDLEITFANMFHTDPNTVERVALLRVRR